MSHSLSLHTHSTKPAKVSNVSPLHPSGSTTMKIAPLSVLIHCSESSRLKKMKSSKVVISIDVELIWGVEAMKSASLIIAFAFWNMLNL